MTEPLVSIAVCVKDGLTSHGETLFRAALESVVCQTYSNLEILLSDNCSTDGTSEILAQLAREDPRARHLRHQDALTGQGNYMSALRQCSGTYFTWAAGDDLRSANFIEVLVEALGAHPAACLAFSDEVLFSEYGHHLDIPPTPRPIDTIGLRVSERLRQLTLGTCSHLAYGLHRRELLAEYAMYELETGTFDVPLGHFLAFRGELVYVPGATFYRFVLPTPKRPEDYARQNNYRKLGWFFPERLAMTCTRAASDAMAITQKRVSRVRVLLLTYYYQNQGVKGLVYRWLPLWVKALWRRYKARGGT